jgi:hypothetical protein
MRGTLCLPFGRSVGYELDLLDEKYEYAPIEAIRVEHTLAMRNPP